MVPATTAERPPRWLVLPIVFLALASWSGIGAAHEAPPASDDHGTITWHDQPDQPATGAANCEFWAQGSGLDHPNGTIHAVHSHPSEGLHEHLVGTWEGEDAGDGSYRFTAGPFTLHSSGPASLTVGVGDEHRSDEEPLLYTACQGDPGVPSVPGLPVCTAADAGSPEDVELPVVFC